MDDRVIVLLSTYNGEKYIAEQIDSILKQSYDNIRLFIRDDGSKDNTAKILQGYENNPKIEIVYGKNMGFFSSFLWLLNHCENAGYYAFSDQDDYWYPEKIEVAVNYLKEKEDKPAVYCCNMNFGDENLKNLKKHSVKYPFTIERTIVNGECGFGFTQVMNNKARNLMLGKNAPTYVKSIGHDAWVHLLCLSCGEVIYDKDVHADMRRHGNNTSVQELHGGTKFTHQIWRINQFFFHDHGKKIYEEISFFYHSFEKELPSESKKIIQRYITTGNRMKKVMYPKRYRDSLADEILLRILFLIGRM